ncbi:hypothetical protein ACH42_11090 [Endozoicomonas sp. (ex Bugula neritina AB1)]|nr:hypothetical protein ACH42_11090 [Endozoicomonas sp. (ex Bugula neritina AB1)]
MHINTTLSTALQSGGGTIVDAALFAGKFAGKVGGYIVIPSLLFSNDPMASKDRIISNIALFGSLTSAQDAQIYLEKHVVKHRGVSDFAAAGLFVGGYILSGSMIPSQLKGTSVVIEGVLVSAITSQIFNGVDKLIISPVTSSVAPGKINEYFGEGKLVTQGFRAAPLLIMLIPGKRIAENPFVKGIVFKGVYESATFLNMLAHHWGIENFKPIFHSFGVYGLASVDGMDTETLRETYDSEAQEQLGYHTYNYIIEKVKEFVGEENVEVSVVAASFGVAALDCAAGCLLTSSKIKVPYLFLGSPASVRNGVMTAAVMLLLGYLDSEISGLWGYLMNFYPDNSNNESSSHDEL